MLIRLMEPVRGFEPLTCGLRNRCSTTELHRPASINRRFNLFCKHFANVNLPNVPP